MSWANITPSAKKYVKNVLDRGWLSYSLYQPRFERDVAYLHSARSGVLMSSGTDALRIALLTLKEVNRWKDGDEVIVPAVTFVATVNAVLQSRLTVRFADVVRSSCNLDPMAVEKAITSRTRAILPVHLFGLPAEMVALKAIAQKHKLKIVEDSCETFGVHSLVADFAAFSFYMSHHVTAGVGGMLLTNDPKLEKIARSYMNHGRIDDGSHFQFGRVGYSSRCTEMEAALGLAALEKFPETLKIRRSIASMYAAHLAPIAENVIRPPSALNHSWMFYPVLLRTGKRDALLNCLRANEIESREAMPLISQPVFRDLYKKGSCPNAELWTKNGLLLPLHPLMKERDVEYVTKIVRGFFDASTAKSSR